MAPVDLHQAGEHRIVLGDSLKDDAEANNAIIDIKYNWQPKSGFDRKSGIITENNGKVDLKLGSKDDEYSYTGWLADSSDQPQLVLIYDNERSVYVLEKLTASLNMNIKSASKIPADQIKRYAPLKHDRPVGDGNAGDASDADLFDDDSESSPDPTNPFDYRNFISDAKQQAEKQAQRGISTPLAGGRTPMSGLSSPMPLQAHLTDTPPLAPIEIIAASNRKLDDYPRRRQAQKPKTTKRVQPAKSNTTKTKALSQAVVVDSDSDSDSDSDVPAPPRAKGHNRNVSDISAAKSPQIRLNNADIDSDSNSSVSRRDSPRPSQSQQRETTMPDADDSEFAQYLVPDDEEDDGRRNADVADLDLEFDDLEAQRSPSPPPIIAPKPKRKGSMKKRRPRSPSPPQMSHSSAVDDYDGGLAAELEAALEQEAQPDHDAGVGLGIGVAGGQDDESDISEEE